MKSAAAVWVLLASCAPENAVDGRPYALSIPLNVSAANPLPLVILLHGYGAIGESEDAFVLPFSKDLSARPFFYAMPNGSVDKVSKRFWNGTDACCDYGKLEVDDVAYLRRVIADVKSKHPVDPRRVFVIGHSNGGFMALRMACDASDVVTGAVSLNGAVWLDPTRCTPGRPLSVLVTHGTADEVIRFNGGSTRAAGYPSAPASITTLARRNGCTGAREAVGRSDFIGDSENETTREAFTGCPQTGRAELWSVEGGSHIPAMKEAWRRAVIDWLNADR